MSRPETSERRTGSGSDQQIIIGTPQRWLTLALVALLIAAVAPVLRVMYPILYVIGEDWSYPGVGAVGLLLYCAPLLAGAGSRLRPGSGLMAGVGAVALSVGLVVAADPISRWAAGSATVLALAGLTLTLLRLAGTGIGRVTLFAGFIAGMALDTAVRGAAHTWDLVWHPGAGWALVSALPALASLVVGWRLARELPSAPATRSSARTSAMLALGGLVALQVLFLQSPGFVSSLAAVDFWLGLFVVLAADAAALWCLGVVPRLASSRTAVAAVSVAGVLGAVALAVVTGRWVIAVVFLAQVALCQLVAVSLSPELPEPARVHGLAGPARAAAAATSALVVIFVWQFYVDTALPFPRWVIALVAGLLVAIGALIATRATAASASSVDLRRSFGVLAAASLGLALVVPFGMWVNRPGTDIATTSSPTVRVMTYNIRSGANTEGQLRPDEIAEAIRSFVPDVVVLQEVGRGWSIHAGTDVAAYLESELDLPALFVGSADDQFGNVVLSRLPMTTVATGILPDAGGQRRSYASVRIDVAGRPLMVVGSHLEDRSALQIRALRDIVGSTTPAVIAGDLNLHPDEPEVAELDGLIDVVEATGDRCRPTSAEPIRPCDRPDWILLTEGLDVQDVAIGTAPASDHLPLIATLRLAD